MLITFITFICTCFQFPYMISGLRQYVLCHQLVTMLLSFLISERDILQTSSHKLILLFDRGTLFNQVTRMY